MAPAVSWKSSSCWRKRMACGTKRAWFNKSGTVSSFHGDKGCDAHRDASRADLRCSSAHGPFRPWACCTLYLGHSAITQISAQPIITDNRSSVTGSDVCTLPWCCLQTPPELWLRWFPWRWWAWAACSWCSPPFPAAHKDLIILRTRRPLTPTTAETTVKTCRVESNSDLFIFKCRRMGKMVSTAE